MRNVCKILGLLEWKCSESEYILENISRGVPRRVDWSPRQKIFFNLQDFLEKQSLNRLYRLIGCFKPVRTYFPINFEKSQSPQTHQGIHSYALTNDIIKSHHKDKLKSSHECLLTYQGKSDNMPLK